MTIATLANIAARLMNSGKGLLAVDESTETCNRRFAVAGIPQTEASRRAYRELLVCTPGLSKSISGAILFDETIRQRTTNGMLFTQVLIEAGIILGIKVDLGAKPLAAHPGERVTEGLDSLGARLQAYHAMGARFGKWRAVFTVGASLPTTACITANAHTLACYAALCQEASLVPIVEPEVLMDGQHTLEVRADVTHRVLHSVFEQLDQQSVQVEGMILKCNMVLPGLACPVQDDIDAVANATLACLLRSVPAAVAGVAFLSGGQTVELASARLNAMHRPRLTRQPWPLTFSFGRAQQQPALAVCTGDDANRDAAQNALLHRAACNSAALRGAYDPVTDAA